MSPKIIATISIFWAGMVAAISFLESWVKFRTPTLQKAVGLDVGRTVFGFFNKIQMALLIAILVLAFNVVNINSILFSILLVLTAIVFLQNIWLFPKLAKRVDYVIKGEPLPPSKVHTVYGLLEIIKLAILLWIGWYLV